MKLVFEPPYDTWYTVREAAKALVTVGGPGYVRKLADEGKLNSKRFTSPDSGIVRILIDPESVEQYNKERTEASMSALVVRYGPTIDREIIVKALEAALGAKRTDSTLLWYIQDAPKKQEPSTVKKVSLSKQPGESEEEYTQRLVEAFAP